MKFGVIIPDRNDRLQFTSNCLRLISRQTIQPEIVELVNFKPTDGEKDITKRYRVGYDSLRNKQLDAIFFIENDDWYAANYFEVMLNEWEQRGRPGIFGTDYTIYYHILEKSHFTMYHNVRSSAMSTLIRPDLQLQWPKDDDPYTDITLWHQIINKAIFKPERHICLGIKHGVGLCGGANHTDFMKRYINDDDQYKFLSSIVDAESLNFYKKIANEIQSGRAQREW